MKHSVQLTEDAAADLADIVDYVAASDGAPRAIRVLAQFESVIQKLEELPARGVHPPELLALGIRDYREVFFKPYRVIYRVQPPTVWVYLIADGRRDMQQLLARRLLGG